MKIKYAVASSLFLLSNAYPGAEQSRLRLLTQRDLQQGDRDKYSTTESIGEVKHGNVTVLSSSDTKSCSPCINIGNICVSKKEVDGWPNAEVTVDVTRTRLSLSSTMLAKQIASEIPAMLKEALPGVSPGDKKYLAPALDISPEHPCTSPAKLFITYYFNATLSDGEREALKSSTERLLADSISEVDKNSLIIGLAVAGGVVGCAALCLLGYKCKDKLQERTPCLKDSRHTGIKASLIG